MAMFPNLKFQIFRLGLHQNRIAQELGISDTVLSKIINGYRQPSVEERKKLAACLRADEAWLFAPCEPMQVSEARASVPEEPVVTQRRSDD